MRATDLGPWGLQDIRLLISKTFVRLVCKLYHTQNSIVYERTDSA